MHPAHINSPDTDTLKEISTDIKPTNTALVTSDQQQLPGSVAEQSAIASFPGATFYSQILYRCLLGSFRISTKSRFGQRDRRTVASKVTALIKIQTITLAPSFLNYVFELVVSQKFGVIERSLRVCPVVDPRNTSVPVFDMCQQGDIEGLMRGFARRDFSPFILDPSGASLLHVRGLCQII